MPSNQDKNKKISEKITRKKRSKNEQTGVHARTDAAVHAKINNRSGEGVLHLMWGGEDRQIEKLVVRQKHRSEKEQKYC
jgi:hypothetical protein